MNRLIKVFVCDKHGYGVSGYKVKLYGDDNIKKTDSDGMASLLVSSDTCTIYVNGSEAYDGYTSKAPDPVIYTMS